MSVILSVRNLSSGYGKISAVRDIDLDIEKGQAVTVIGPNGAGKTTLLNCLMGLRPGTGAVTFKGERIDGLAVEERLERGLCLVAERRELFSDMSVADNLLLGGYSRRLEGTRPLNTNREQIYDFFPRLRERKGQLAGTLSGGERQMLAIGRALMARPELLMLDEPSLGLAPLIVEEVFQILARLREAGVSILLVEQNARAALSAADSAYVLETGEIVLRGNSRELMADRRIEDVYLGGSVEQDEGAPPAYQPEVH